MEKTYTITDAELKRIIEWAENKIKHYEEFGAKEKVLYYQGQLDAILNLLMTIELD